MGKRILLVWEIGAGQGHLLQLAWVAHAVRARGHHPILAVTRTASLPPAATYDSIEVLESPIWPGNRGAYQLARRTTGLSDDLARAGIGSSEGFAQLLREWDRLFSVTMPDVLIGDAAPASLAAARGRIPTVAIGNGFTLPPASVERLRAFDPAGSPPQVDEASLVDAVNVGLRATGRAPLQFLSEIYRADRTCVGTFAEFDPYRDLRADSLTAPWLPEWEGGAEMKRQELFCYLSFNIKERRTILLALAQVAAQGIPTCVYIPKMSPDTAQWLADNNIRAETTRLTLNEIQRRARLTLSFGSLGFVSFSLAAGIPQIVTPHSLSHEVTGNIVAGLGAGHRFKLDATSPFEIDLLARAIHQLYTSDELTERAKSLAPVFVRRAFPRTSERVAGLIEELL